MAEGKDGVLPCGLEAPVDSQVITVEWLRVDGPSEVTLKVLRHSKDLVKDQAPQYKGRTSILQNGSLKLLGVQRQDTGTYKYAALPSQPGNRKCESFPHQCLYFQVCPAEGFLCREGIHALPPCWYVFISSFATKLLRH